MSEAPSQLTEEQRQALEQKLKNMSPEELAQFQKQQCIFCQIISGKIPSQKVFEDDKVMAILDINPAAKGHLLLLPKEHYMIMPQVPEADLLHLFSVAKKLSQRVLRGFKSQGTTLFVANGLIAGQRAQHFMVHIIPRREGDHLIPFDEKLIDEELRKKVKLAVEKRFNQLMGIEKEVVDAVEIIPPKPLKDVKRRNEDREMTEEYEESAEKEEKLKSKKKTSKKKEVESEVPISHKLLHKKEEEIRLDDIANLFK
ncbi:HIT domain-containing protein [Candidatus Woesearchaeota archaeon]|nr:HIT domain-containing protein [Candidatus Woesearchaeota archaeon]